MTTQISNVIAVGSNTTGTAPQLYQCAGSPDAATYAGVAPPGALLVDVQGAQLYINTGNAQAPLWAPPGLRQGGAHDPAASYGPRDVVTDGGGLYVCTAAVDALGVPFGVLLRGDTFARADQDGWGTASGPDDGFDWADAGISWANGDVSIASAQGVQAGNGTGDGRFMRAGDALPAGANDTEVLLRWTLVAPDTGFQALRLTVRSTPDTRGGAQATLWVYLNGTTQMEILGDYGPEQPLGSWAGAASGTALWTRYRAVGHTYAWRTWADGDDEPTAWDGTYTSGITTSPDDRCVLVALQGNGHAGDSLAIDSFSVAGPTAPAADADHWQALAPAPAQSGVPVLRGPYVVDYNMPAKGGGTFDQDGATVDLWTPERGDVLLRLFPDVDRAHLAQWDNGYLFVGQNVSVNEAGNPVNALAAAVGQIAGYGSPALDSLVDVSSGVTHYDGTSAHYVSAQVFHSADPVQILFRNPGNDPAPGSGHVELYALIARALAP